MTRRESNVPLRLLAERPAPTLAALLGWPLLVLAAVRGHPLLFAVALVATYLADERLGREPSRLDRLLRSTRFPLTVRFVLRQLLLLLLLVRLPVETRVLTVAVATLAAFYVLQVPQSVLLSLVRRSRRLPMASRNIDLSALRLRPAPSRLLTSRAFEKSMHLDLCATAGLLATAHTGDPRHAYLGCAATLGLCLLYAALLARLALRVRGAPGRGRVLAHLDAWLREYQPTVVLYFSGTRGSAYQVNMWLRTMATVDGRPLVVLRERHILDALEPTALPVVCLPAATDVMNRDFSSVRVALYPANVGPNIHLLRLPRVRHVFIGHGDSDKVASVNPYAKVYDEVWTAGRAGRDRWSSAGVGVRDSAIVEVGRPQLDAVRRGGGDTVKATNGAPFTVLYAPTWEGWTTEPGNTSLIESGEAIVRLLLSLEAPVRVLYKPHPYTGIRAPEARAAHRAIVAMLEEANAERAATVPGFALAAGDDAALRESARADLARVEKELAALDPRPRRGVDDAERSRDALLTPAEAAQRDELRRSRDELFWRSREPWRHQHITARGPHLYSCFNACDLLVSDISSVVSDFVASEKPYAITDVEGVGEREFRRRYTAASAAFILSRDAHELNAVVRGVRSPEDDPLTEERRRLRHYLLGPDTPSASARFNTALQALSPAPPPGTSEGPPSPGPEPTSVPTL
ncbi:hypothetical protein E0L36_00825 [Streptomyces sp. AJS327]|uniref:hypothetical protein n=1 Tax=Streptomyces sp. AJS327 TaxID=2545265 RepID=UPI0015E0113C|nr:hypothetical protein [Streptomyces sp. AJS327]MBA0049506.1 hypothetical protein [Streptomyces sp. AJS327]